MSVDLRVCRTCQRSMPADATQCRHCSPASTCVCCGAALKRAMLRCRECGTSAVNPSQRNAAPNSITKTVAAVGLPESHQLTASEQAAGSQPIQVKPSAAHPQLPQTSTYRSRRQSADSIAPPRTQQRMKSASIRWRISGIVSLSVAALLLAIGFVMRTDPAIQTAAVNPGRERAAAIWVVQHYGVVEVRTNDGEVRRYVAAEHLPEEAFSITEINLYGQDFDERELAFLPELAHLEKIDISRTTISSTGMRYIGRVPTLKSLQLRVTNLSADAFRLLKNGPAIEKCSVSGSKTFDDAVLTAASETMPNLKVFSCTSTSITDNGIKALMKLKAMNKLIAAKNQWSDQALKQLQDALPNCTLAI